MNSNGWDDSGETAAAGARQVKKYLRRCQFSVPILPLNTSACETKSYATAKSFGSLYRRGRLSLTDSRKSSYSTLERLSKVAASARDFAEKNPLSGSFMADRTSPRQF